jgi:uncharacterized repeat protein (TIGR03803 family)
MGQIESLERRTLFSTFNMLYGFAAPYHDPNAILVDSNGNLFGTVAGGTNGDGALWELPVGATAATILANFTGSNGLVSSSDPPAALLIDSHGDLFGTADEGGIGFKAGPSGVGSSTATYGVVFELLSGSTTITDVGQFSSTYPSGEDPLDGLLMDSSGDLFGTTSAGGSEGEGTIWEIPAGADSVTTLASFSDTSNAGGEYDDDPTGGIAIDSQGNLYGTATGTSIPNDSAAQGAVWELSAATHKITNLGVFNGSNEFGSPDGLVRDSSGDLFGVASGDGGNGVVWEIPAGGTLASVASFDGAAGSATDQYADTLTFSGGNLFGVSSFGGSGDGGTIWELSGGSINTLYSFNGNADDGDAPDSIVYDSATSLFYGTTTNTEGGAGHGTIYSFSPSAGAMQLAFTAQPTNLTAGASFTSDIVVEAEDSSGNLVSSFNGNVTLGSKTVPSGVTFNAITVAAVNGVATFTGIPDFDIAGGYKLKATQSGLTPAKSDKFFVTAAAASQLVFATQPTDAVAGNPQGQITVDVEDQFGNILADDDSTLVALATKIAPAGENFTPVSVDDVDGVATFTGVIFDTAGGYKLKATHTGLTPGKSVKFFVVA